jgi:hypothetical protein
VLHAHAHLAGGQGSVFGGDKQRVSVSLSLRTWSVVVLMIATLSEAARRFKTGGPHS